MSERSARFARVSKIRSGERARRPVLARVKLNLCLHITGRRPDGLHALDGVVAFAGIGDRVEIRCRPSGIRLDLEPGAPFAASVPAGESNLAWRAAARLLERAEPCAGAEIRLLKRIPVGAGLGGGSADAAAVLDALRRSWVPSMDDRELAALAFELGADIPVCLHGRPARVRGAGERVDELHLPPFWCAVVWPGSKVSTSEAYGVFAQTGAAGPGLPRMPDRFRDPMSLSAWLRQCRNDLADAARRLAPGLDAVREALLGAGAMHALMTGAGSAHWGMFHDEGSARRAVAQIRTERPDWWCKAAHVAGDGPLRWRGARHPAPGIESGGKPGDPGREEREEDREQWQK